MNGTKSIFRRRRFARLTVSCLRSAFGSSVHLRASNRLQRSTEGYIHKTISLSDLPPKQSLFLIYLVIEHVSHVTVPSFCRYSAKLPQSGHEGRLLLTTSFVSPPSLGDFLSATAATLHCSCGFEALFHTATSGFALRFEMWVSVNKDAGCGDVAV